MRALFCLLGLSLCLMARPTAQQPSPQSSSAIFRASSELVSIDVAVRDRSGNIVRGLTPGDFEIREDGRVQELLTLSFQELDSSAAPLGETELLAGVDTRVRDAASGVTLTARPRADRPLDDSYAGRRLVVLLFDLTSMDPDDVQRGVDAASRFVREQMSSADAVAIVTFSASLDILTDFTGDRAALLGVLGRLGASDGTFVLPGAPALVDPAADPDAAVPDDSGFDLYNNDTRLRALRILSDALAPIDQKKAVLYFSGGIGGDGEDNQVELRAAANAAVRANVAFYPVDARGLHVVVPGGAAREPSRGGQGLFSGRNVQQQYDDLAASRDTLVSLASDTGGRPFFDSNDLGSAFTRVQRDTAAYYLLGYSSSNPAKDGRFRRIEVRVKRPGVTVEARSGYYADRDFTHTNRLDRAAQLQEQLDATVSSTDLPVMMSTQSFRTGPGNYYVSVDVTVPGAALASAPPSPSDERRQTSVDILGQVRDEQGRPVGRIRDTLQLPADSGETFSRRQFLYHTGLTLPAGRFTVKAVVRENSGGAVGSFEAALLIPDLERTPLKISSVVLSTQLQPLTKGRTEDPLVRDGMQLVPNLTHIVGRGQRIYFYYEVYEPALGGGLTPMLRTSLAFYRGGVKVFDTPVVEHDTIDDQGRKASIFRLELPPESLPPALYTCQINVIDAVAGRFAFPHVTLLVR